MVAEIFGMDGIIVAVVVIGVIFGANKIPQIARSLGSAKQEFAKGQKDGVAGLVEQKSSEDTSSLSSPRD